MIEVLESPETSSGDFWLTIVLDGFKTAVQVVRDQGADLMSNLTLSSDEADVLVGGELGVDDIPRLNAAA